MKSFKVNVALLLAGASLLAAGTAGTLSAAPLPGGTLDPLSIPKYVTPLVIPPEMPKSTVQPVDPANPAAPQPAADYNIALRQFQQQILPAGFLPTTVWSYGRAQDVPPTGFVAPAPLANGVSFNYPAFTVEADSGVLTKVRWINELKNKAGKFLPHLFTVDQTLHWANPAGTGCVDPMNPAAPPYNGTDCTTANALPYAGPVPMAVHLHGAHVNAQSDGYPQSWWLPAANNLAGYTPTGSAFTQYDPSNTVPGSAFYGYENSQSASTLWYHDHSLGMTRLNVYAGPAGFWLIRGGANGDAGVLNSAGLPAVLPGPAPAAPGTPGGGDPNFDPAYRATIREIPIAIQDRSFNKDGTLFYPASRSFFDGFKGPYAPTSDIAPFWNPEAFFNTMVVNGSTWPKLEVAPAKYRFRLLNGTNSRFLNLALFQVTTAVVKRKTVTQLGSELPFYQIGAEQGFLPKVVQVQTGFATTLPGDGSVPPLVAAPDPAQALLMGPAERADVIVDFSALPNGTVVRMINTAPDAPFGGFPDIAADPSTTGQVMQFVVNSALTQPGDVGTTPPQNLVLPFEGPIGAASVPPRGLSLNEMMSDQVCVKISLATGVITTLFVAAPNDPNFMMNCTMAGGEPMGPRMALLGTFDQASASAVPLMWHDPLTESIALGSTEQWEIHNLTVDAHPIHVHLVKFQLIDRQLLDPVTLQPAGVPTPALPSEQGYKDTVIAYPGQVTRIRATFDVAGNYVWHCHIVEHEDNEMMRPFVVQ